MANLVARSGAVHIRVGGNSQEDAELLETLPGVSPGTILSKDKNNTSNPTQTPPLDYTQDLLVMLGKISEFTNVFWYLGKSYMACALKIKFELSLGVPFYNITPVDTDIIVVGDGTLGDRVLAYQVGNEPDLYGFNGRNHRPPVSMRSYFLHA
jgi:hypothetical protein